MIVSLIPLQPWSRSKQQPSPQSPGQDPRPFRQAFWIEKPEENPPQPDLRPPAPRAARVHATAAQV